MRPRNEVVDLDSRSVLPSGPWGLVVGFRHGAVWCAQKIHPVTFCCDFVSGEYLVNIGQRRRAAQKRVTGGRWRRVVLGHVLAEQVLELRGRACLWP